MKRLSMFYCRARCEPFAWSREKLPRVHCGKLRHNDHCAHNGVDVWPTFRVFECKVEVPT